MIVIGIGSDSNAAEQIENYGAFTVNIPMGQSDILAETEQAGMVSHRDKLAMTNLTYEISQDIKVPLLTDCALVLECQVEQIVHAMGRSNVIAKITKRLIDESLLDAKGNLNHQALTPLIYMGDGKARAYRQLDESVTPLGKFMREKKRQKKFKS